MERVRSVDKKGVKKCEVFIFDFLYSCFVEERRDKTMKGKKKGGSIQ